MLRKGLTFEEQMNLDLVTFFELHIFDQYIEPQSPVVTDTHFALLQDAIYRSSGNMTKQGLKSMKVSDFRLIPIERIFKSKEEIEEINKAKTKKHMAGILAGISDQDRQKLEALTKKKGVVNGK